MTIQVGDRVGWVGPGAEATGRVTSRLRAPNGTWFMFVEWDEDAGSVPYAPATIERHLVKIEETEEAK